MQVHGLIEAHVPLPNQGLTQTWNPGGGWFTPVNPSACIHTSQINRVIILTIAQEGESEAHVQAHQQTELCTPQL